MADQSTPVIITGCSGFIGETLTERIAQRHPVIGLDVKPPSRRLPGTTFLSFDLTSDDSVRSALDQVREEHGERIASVVHLAAYFDLSGEPNPLYDKVTVQGSERLMRALQRFEVEQFLFSSTMLVHEPVRPGERLNEEQPLTTKFPYRGSKVAAENALRAARGAIPLVLLRPAGVYDDQCRNPFLAHQIAWIYERRFEAHVYPGNLDAGQSFVHLEDLVDAVAATVEHRGTLPAEVPILIGEPDPMSIAELHEAIGQLIHGKDWTTWRVPKAIARVGAVVERQVGLGDPFIRPWMIASADDHYALDITRARTLLGWQPRHNLRAELPRMIDALKADPEGWYKGNKLDPANIPGR